MHFKHNESKIHIPNVCVTERGRANQPQPWQVNSGTKLPCGSESTFFRVMNIRIHPVLPNAWLEHCDTAHLELHLFRRCLVFSSLCHHDFGIKTRDSSLRINSDGIAHNLTLVALEEGRIKSQEFLILQAPPHHCAAALWLLSDMPKAIAPSLHPCATWLLLSDKLLWVTCLQSS